MFSARSTCRRASVALLIGLSACGGTELPTAPSDLVEGISIYEHANYLGESALLVDSSMHLSDFKGPCEHTSTDSNGSTSSYYDWADCISSIRITPGWRAILYRDNDYKGESIELLADAPNLQLVSGTCDHDGLNDCVSSIKIIPRGRPF